MSTMTSTRRDFLKSSGFLVVSLSALSAADLATLEEALRVALAVEC